MSSSRKIEHPRVPEHFQRRIDAVGGKNRYGQSNFRLAWGQSEFVRHGGQWEADGEWFTGYQYVPLGDNLPHWMLLRWIDAGKSIDLPSAPAQSAEAWLDNTRCGETGLRLLGGYQYQGSYQVAANLTAKWMEGDELKVIAFPLSSYIVDMIIPIIQATQLITKAAKQQAMKDEDAKQKEDYRAQLYDASLDAQLPAHVQDSEWIADRVRMMERALNQGLIRAWKDQGLQTIQRGR
jgi:hypothetical protein